MSADRETNHDMTHRDIALLLADAADEAEIGIAPYQAVVRGGRRRKARRWALAAAAALVIAGSTGTLALAGVTGGDAQKVAPAATRPPTGEERHVYEPQRTTLGKGYGGGNDWEVTIDVWGAPKDGAEAQRQWTAMEDDGGTPMGARDAEKLIGNAWYFVHARVGDRTSMVMTGQFEKGDTLSGAEFESGAIRMPSSESVQPGAPNRLVIGDVAPTARHVTCTWNDGTTTEVPRAPEGAGFGPDFKPYIRPVKGSQPNWFVCVAPEGTSYKSVKVTG
ncbi:hypothetical protein [Streptomyces olivochromogenes]|uniref:Uncharacterized protein n=1 Tax=Streptomyces olivochromogenes TaxID=1963 RepID=A0A250V6X6_STROL|nr:hypothetical protein [Streptomyces olivochromogenes]GAX49786.1 hypothetical protein SO3561_01275 [Streptomyces olivochromogenes]